MIWFVSASVSQCLVGVNTDGITPLVVDVAIGLGAGVDLSARGNFGYRFGFGLCFRIGLDLSGVSGSS
jgi:hypothetical protein